MANTQTNRCKIDASGKPAFDALHGALYQSKLLLFYLIHGIALNYSFSLTSEEKKAEKFDDLVLRFRENDVEKCILLQAKHKADETKKISFTHLFINPKSKNRDNMMIFNLVTYFFGFYKCIRQNLFLNEENIKNVILCTNIDLDKSSKYATRELHEVLVEFEESTGFLNLSNRNLKKPTKLYKFNKFAVPILTGILEKYLRESNDTKCKEYLVYSEKITNPNFIKNDVKTFFKYFVLAVNQPNETELEEIIQEKIEHIEIKQLLASEKKFIYQNLFGFILKWLKSNTTEAEKFKSDSDGRNMLDEAKCELEVFYCINEMRLSESDLPKVDISFLDCVIEQINAILMDANYQLINLFNENNTELNTLKAYNCIHKSKNLKGRYLFVKINSTDKLTNGICKYLEENIDLMIIQYSTKTPDDLETFYEKLQTFLEKDENKKVVIISNHSIFVRSNSKAIHVQTIFTDLGEHSREYILEKQIALQGSKIELRRLLADGQLQPNDDVLQKLNDILNEGMLLEIVKGETSINIGRQIKELGYLEHNYINRKLHVKPARSNFDMQTILMNQIQKFVEPNTLMDIPLNKVLISSDAGMGKSSLITKLVHQSKMDDPSLLILRIDLINYSNDFKYWKEKKVKIVELDIIKLLCKAIITETDLNSKHSDWLEHFEMKCGQLQYTVAKNLEINHKTLFEIKLFVETYNQSKLNVILDGFDEIIPTFNNKGIEFAKKLNELKLQRFWLTTRAYDILSSLEELYNCAVYELVGFSEDQQKNFLFQHLKTSTDGDDIAEFREFFSDVFYYDDQRNSFKSLMTVPLYLKMIGDLLKKPYEKFRPERLYNDNLELQIKEFDNLASLFDSFLLQSFDMLFEKGQEKLNKTAFIQTAIDDLFETSIHKHQELAVIDLWYYDEELQNLLLSDIKLLDINNKDDLISKLVHGTEKFGLVDRDEPPKNFRFTIRSFAEYLAAFRIWNRFYDAKSEDYKSIIEKILLKAVRNRGVCSLFVVIARNYLTNNSNELDDNIFKKLNYLLSKCIEHHEDESDKENYLSIIDLCLPLKKEFFESVQTTLGTLTVFRQYEMLKYFLENKNLQLAEAILQNKDSKRFEIVFQLESIDHWSPIKYFFRSLQNIDSGKLAQSKQVMALLEWKNIYGETLYRYAIENRFEDFRKLYMNLNSSCIVDSLLNDSITNHFGSFDTDWHKLFLVCKLLNRERILGQRINPEDILGQTDGCKFDLELRTVSLMQYYFFNEKDCIGDPSNFGDCATIIKAFLYNMINEMIFRNKYVECDMTKCIQNLVKDSSVFSCKNRQYRHTTLELARHISEIHKFLIEIFLSNKSFEIRKFRDFHSENVLKWVRETFDLVLKAIITSLKKSENDVTYKFVVNDMFIYLICENIKIPIVPNLAAKVSILENKMNCFDRNITLVHFKELFQMYLKQGEKHLLPASKYGQKFQIYNSYFVEISDRLLKKYDAKQSDGFNYEETLKILALEHQNSEEGSAFQNGKYFFEKGAVEILVYIFIRNNRYTETHDFIMDLVDSVPARQRELERAVQFLEELEKLYDDLSDAIKTNDFERTETLLQQHPDYIKSLINGKDDEERTLLQYAESRGNRRIIELILKEISLE